MAYKLHYGDYPGTDTGPPDPERWVGPPGPTGPMGPQGVPGPPGPNFPEAPVDGHIYGRGGATPAWIGVLPLTGGTVTGATTVQGNLTGGTGAGTWRLNSGTTGNWTFQLGSTTSVWNMQTSDGTNLLQLTSTPKQALSKYQLVLHGLGSTAPNWVSGAGISQTTPLYTSNVWGGTSTVAGANTPLIALMNATANLDASASNSATLYDSNVTVGSNFKGNLHNITAAITLTTPNANTLAAGQNTYSTGVITAQASVNDAGTDTGANSHGGLQALNTVCHLLPGATNWHGVCSLEADFGIETGASAMDKVGIMIGLMYPVQGARDDAALVFSSNPSCGSRSLIQVGNSAGYNPMDPTAGWVLSFRPHLGVGTLGAAGGLDFTNFVPTTAFMRGNNFLLDQNGNLALSGSGTALTVQNNASIGQVTLGADPTLPMQAVTKQYGDNRRQRTVYTNLATTPSVGASTAEEVLFVWAIPAGLLANVGDIIHTVLKGDFAATTDNKSFRIRIGSNANGITGATNIGSVTGSATTTVNGTIESWLMKASPSAQKAIAISYAASNAISNAEFSATVTDTGIIYMSVTAQNSTAAIAASMTSFAVFSEYMPALA